MSSYLSVLQSCLPGDRTLEFALSMTIGASLLSTLAWIACRLGPRAAAARHLIVVTALLACLGLPIAGAISGAAGWTLVAITIFCPKPREVVAPPMVVLPVFGCAADAPPRVERIDWVGDPTRRQSWGGDEPDGAGIAERAVDAQAFPERAEVVSRAGDPAWNIAAKKPAGGSSARGADPPRGWLVAIGRAALVVWGTICGMLLIRLAVGSWRVSRVRASARLGRDERIVRLAREGAVRIGAREIPSVLFAKQRVAPLALGIFRPAIVVPESLLSDLSDEELLDVLVHELSHLHRGDQRTALLAELVVALYWPIASIHWLKRELRRSREELSDNAVLAAREALDYGQTLFRIGERLAAPIPLQLAVGMSIRAGELERRIAGLFDPLRDRRTSTSRRSVVMTGAVFVAASLLLTLARLSLPAASAAEPAAAAPESQNVTPSAEATKTGDPAIFHGRVSGPKGEAIPGARIYAVGFEQVLDYTIETVGDVRAVADRDGNFSFRAADLTFLDIDGLPSRRDALLIAEAEGYGPDWRFLQKRKSKSEEDLTFRLANASVTIRGQLLDASERPISGAVVKLAGLSIPKDFDLDKHLEREVTSSPWAGCGPSYQRTLHRPDLIPGLTDARTDSDGRFELKGLGDERVARLDLSSPVSLATSLTVITRDAARITVRAGKPGEFPTLPKQYVYGAQFTANLKPGRTIAGVVRDRQTGAPLPGMRVGLAYKDPRAPVKSEYVVSDEQGRFLVVGLDPTVKEKWSIAAAAPAGVDYFTGLVEVDGDEEVVIECLRGIPFRLVVTDEKGQSIAAEVFYDDVRPNPHAPGVRSLPTSQPLSRAIRQSDGSYHGFAAAGPGAIFVRPHGHEEFLPARVDPQAFFNGNGGIVENHASAYGTLDTVSTSFGPQQQTDYAAIVLINPPMGSEALEFSAQVTRAKRPIVTLVDPAGEPVVGAQSEGMTDRLYDGEPMLRAAKFPLEPLHPERTRRVRFTKEDRQLTGALVAHGNTEAYTVEMRPWGTIAGRIVDAEGQPLPIGKAISDWKEAPKLSLVSASGETDIYADCDSQGRFRVERLIPGERYRVMAYVGLFGQQSTLILDELVVEHGETRDLGDLRSKFSYAPSYRKPSAEDAERLAQIPEEAWGAPVNGLRMAILPSEPFVDDHDRLRYQIVAENVGDRELRFSAADAYIYNYYQIGLRDEAGQETHPMPGKRTPFYDSARLWRRQLQPGERMLVSHGVTQLARLDEAGERVPLKNDNEYLHVIEAKPGKYVLSAKIEIGRGKSHDPAKGVMDVDFAVPGEWIGSLSTGSAPIVLPEKS